MEVNRLSLEMVNITNIIVAVVFEVGEWIFVALSRKNYSTDFGYSIV